MTDRIQQLLEIARADAMREVRPPGTAQVRRTVRRRRGLAAGAGAVAVVAAIAAGGALAGPPPRIHDIPLGGPSAGPSGNGAPVLPPPGPEIERRAAAAYAALGDRDTVPWVMATSGVVLADYRNHVNDIPAGRYVLSVYCAGEGAAAVTVKAFDVGDEKLAGGTVTCAEKPRALRLTVRQPVDGYLRVLLAGDARAANSAAFSFSLTPEDPPPSPHPS